MAEYDYGNARVRAMKARLLSRRELENLVELGNLTALISDLMKTAYQPALEYSLARTTGVEIIMEALRYDLNHTMRKVRSFYKNRAGEVLDIIFRKYDVHNLKAILRGSAKHAPPSEISMTLLPIGEISHNLLVDFSRQPSPRDVIDMLASMNLPYAEPLLRLRSEHPGAEIGEMELALERWYFREIQKFLKEDEFEESELLSIAVNIEADIINLMTVLRFAYNPEDRKLLQTQAGTGVIEYLFVGPGMLSFNLLVRATNQDTLEDAVKILAASPYGNILRETLENYGKSIRLSNIEKGLRRYRLNYFVRCIMTDPLGIGVILGYQALKINEVNNLRWIANSIQTGIKRESVRAELEFIS